MQTVNPVRNTGWDTRLGWVGVALAILMTMPACRNPVEKNGEAGRAGDGARSAELVSAYQQSKQVYRLARDGNWAEASLMVDGLQSTLQPHGPAGAVRSPFNGDITLELSRLHEAVRRQDRVAAMGHANRLTMLSVRQTAQYQPRVPPLIRELGYYGREMEIEAAAGSLLRQQEAARVLRQLWDGLRGLVVEQAGNTEAEKFDLVMKRVEAAATVEEFGRLGQAVVNEAESLEKVFLQPAPKPAEGGRRQEPKSK